MQNLWPWITWGAIVIALLSVGILLWQRAKTKRMLKYLSRMLDMALDGSFCETSFNESLLSAIENRLNRYLTASLVSTRNLEGERGRIKELVSDISHQTKTPLANIHLYVQLLEEETLSEAGAGYVRALGKQTEKMRFLITALVKLSRLETGVLQLSPKQGDLRLLLEDVLAQYLPAAESKGITLTFEAGEFCHAIFDPKWTAEAVGNVLDNAIKYTPTGGTIRLQVFSYELFVRVDVQDNGIGIAEAEHANIFSRFYRSPTVAEEDGVGIGLYLTRQILAAQGGYLRLKSAPGEGATFSLYFPREA